MKCVGTRPSLEDLAKSPSELETVKKNSEAWKLESARYRSTIR
jgi:hypothetical protein